LTLAGNVATNSPRPAPASGSVRRNELPRAFIRHAGYEYGYVISARLRVALQFETYELGPGGSLPFDSLLPHRLFNAGNEPVHGLWYVVGRRGASLPTKVAQRMP